MPAATASDARFWRILVTIGFGGALWLLSGCITPATPSGPTASYARGELEANFTRDYGRVFSAAQGALDDLQYPRIGENRDDLRAVLISRTPTDKKIEITLSNSGKDLTAMKIRVGMFGDEQVSQAIFDRIKARL